jgi:TRAP-type mannitol/chloroaromatic compound transport system substrate-binding protein
MQLTHRPLNCLVVNASFFKTEIQHSMKRRQFVTGVAAAAGLSACAEEETASTTSARSTETFEWNMVTSWPAGLPGIGVGVQNLADRLEKTSNGRLKVKVYAGGELVPALEVLDAVSRGTVQMGHDSAYYHRGKVPAAQYFTAVPFGQTVHEKNAWLYYGGGLELWRELYAPFNVIPFVAGNTGVQMAGWFNKEINSVADLKGLKMRIPGVGGEVMRRAGVTQVNVPASEMPLNGLDPTMISRWACTKLRAITTIRAGTNPVLCCSSPLTAMRGTHCPKIYRKLLARPVRQST